MDIQKVTSLMEVFQYYKKLEKFQRAELVKYQHLWLRGWIKIYFFKWGGVDLGGGIWQNTFFDINF